MSPALIGALICCDVNTQGSKPSYKFNFGRLMGTAVAVGVGVVVGPMIASAFSKGK